MRRIITIGCGVLCAALLAGAVTAAGNPTSDSHARNLAAKQCAAEKKADRGAFRSLWGRHAMRNCIRGTVGQLSTELKNAAKECRAERDADAVAFRNNYGTAHSQGRNAFGKCVSSKVHDEIAADVAAFKNAAKECRAERDADADAFRDTYGTAHSRGRNAFGKCVSSKVKHQD
jgi:hypothetical protein